MNTAKKRLMLLFTLLMLALSAMPAFADFNDPDGDGIATRFDACPFRAGPYSNKGCPDQDFAPVPQDAVPSSGVINTGMADGSVKFLSSSINPAPEGANMPLADGSVSVDQNASSRPAGGGDGGGGDIIVFDLVHSP